ncbi:MAG: MotA/TolQ/ExbB proton channel family protein [Verrucomicrobiae bacterium]|nr:MotA/TolQ/ExbB proton channel family protein [Verrucomicrobiae bacterium]
MTTTTPLHRLRPLLPLWLWFALCLGGSNASAQDTTAGTSTSPPPAATVETKSALDIYQEGGWFMHVLLVCSIGTIAVVVYCFVQITPKKMAPKSQVDRVNGCMAGKDVGTAYQLCQSNPNPYANVVSAALLKVNFDRDLANKVSMVEAAGESLDEEEHKQMVWVNYLNVFATLAPMIGLLGTVWGMIESFDQLAAGNAQPQDLAGGIKKAMGTTAGGLLVGIPAMFFYFFFRDKLQGVMTTIQRHASFAIDILSGEIRLEGATTETETGE